MLQVGVPLEDALTAYFDAYQLWNDCVRDTACDTDSINPELQEHWSSATGLIDDARTALRNLRR